MTGFSLSLMLATLRLNKKAFLSSFYVSTASLCNRKCCLVSYSALAKLMAAEKLDFALVHSMGKAAKLTIARLAKELG